MTERERLLHNLRVIAGRVKQLREDLECYEKQQSEILDQLDAVERTAYSAGEKP